VIDPVTLTDPSGAVVFRLPLVIVLIPVAVALVLVGLSILGFRKGAHPILGIIPLVIALVPALLFAPAMYLDRVEVSPDRIEQTTGFFFAPNRKGFEFQDVDYVRMKQAPDMRNRMRTLWEIHERKGTTRDIDPGDLWEMNSQQIEDLLTKHGVRFR
jgi:hypothetical protein